MGDGILYPDRTIRDMKRLDEYKAVIFDVDGTLYFQKPFRIRMMLYLISHVLRHPSSIGDLFLIKKYREVRENWEECEKETAYDRTLSLDERQYKHVAKLMKTSDSRVKAAVEFFMLEAPLKLLPSFKDEELGKTIDELHRKNITVVIYSDYPAETKLKALGIKADYCFCSADERIGTMKPDPKGISVILETLGLESSQALMVGDRYEKDGLAAKANDVDFCILPACPKKRIKLK